MAQCKKRRYNTEVDAKIALAVVRADRERKNPKRKRPAEKKYYRCPYCKGFHLTSKN